MTYSLVHPNKKLRGAWSEEALQAEIRALHKHTQLIHLEKLYNSATSANELNQMLDVLKKHMGVRSRRVRAAFSDQIVNAGYCLLDRKSSIIYVNAAYAGKPAQCAAVLAHNICHFALIESHTIVFENREENEKAADLASIAYGLGLVVLSGAAPIGWRALISRKKRSRNQRPGLGYFSLDMYAQKTNRHLLDVHVTPLEVAQNSCAWIYRLLDPRLRYKGPRTTPLMRDTYARHRSSIRNFWFSVPVYTLCLFTVAFVMLQKPVFLSDELRVQRSRIAKLQTSYEGCADRVSRLQASYSEQDAQIARFIDNERNVCKSLQNRYNYEVNVYHEMQERYKQ